MPTLQCGFLVLVFSLLGVSSSFSKEPVLSEPFFLSLISETFGVIDVPVDEGVVLFHQAVVLRAAGFSYSSVVKAGGFSADLFDQAFWQSFSALSLYRSGVPPEKILTAVRAAKTGGYAPQSGAALLFVALDRVPAGRKFTAALTRLEIERLEDVLAESRVLFRAGLPVKAPFRAAGVDLGAIQDTPLGDFGEVLEGDGWEALEGFKGQWTSGLGFST